MAGTGIRAWLKKTRVVHAIQVITDSDVQAATTWMRSWGVAKVANEPGIFHEDTAEGIRHWEPGTWLVRFDETNEFIAVPNETFVKEYEAIEHPTDERLGP